MAMNDWNHNGKNDSFDNYMDYKLSDGGNSGSSSGPGGGISMFGAILCVISGLVEQAFLYMALDIEVDNVPAIVILILWILFSIATVKIVSCLKR